MQYPKDTGLNPRSVRGDIFPHWEKPKPVGYFSVDTDRFYEMGFHNLRYLKYPNPALFPLDLNKGVEYAKRKNGNPLNEGIDHLFRFIVDNHKNLVTNSNEQPYPLFPIEFVCWRGLLRLIMCTPSEYRQNWIIHVTHYKGIFYLRQIETEEAKNERLRETPLQKNMCSWGYKFEQYCLTESPYNDPKTNIPVDECSEFTCVFTSRLEQHNLLYGAEMDGILGDQWLNLENGTNLESLEFVELKTCLKDMNERQMHSYLSYKIRNWWCQSFLVGIQKLVVGWRDNDGLVWDIEEVPVNHLPKEAKNWSPLTCSWFLISFLNCLKAVMAKVDCPNTVWEFKYNAPHSRITYAIFEGCTGKSFLPDYYVEFIENLSMNRG